MINKIKDIPDGTEVGEWNHKSDKIANSPELRQYLSQSGTIWQGGECVIILNK